MYTQRNLIFLLRHPSNTVIENWNLENCSWAWLGRLYLRSRLLPPWKKQMLSIQPEFGENLNKTKNFTWKLRERWSVAVRPGTCGSELSALHNCQFPRALCAAIIFCTNCHSWQVSTILHQMLGEAIWTPQLAGHTWGSSGNSTSLLLQINRDKYFVDEKRIVGFNSTVDVAKGGGWRMEEMNLTRSRKDKSIYPLIFWMSYIQDKKFQK